MDCDQLEGINRAAHCSLILKKIQWYLKRPVILLDRSCCMLYRCAKQSTINGGELCRI